MQANLSWLCFFSSALPWGVQPNPKPNQPEQPARIDHSDGRWWVSAPKTWRRWVEWRVFFSKTWATWPDRRYTSLAIFEEIQVRFGEIRQHSRRSRLILVIFGADLLGFCRFQRIFWRFQWRFGVFFAQISWVLQKSGDDLMFFCLDLVIFARIRWRSGEKYRSPTKWNLRQHHRQFQPIWPLIKQLWSDLTRWCLRSAVGCLARNPMSSGRFWVGHKPDSDRPMDTPSSPLAEWP